MYMYEKVLRVYGDKIWSCYGDKLTYISWSCYGDKLTCTYIFWSCYGDKLTNFLELLWRQAHIYFHFPVESVVQ